METVDDAKAKAKATATYNSMGSSASSAFSSSRICQLRALAYFVRPGGRLAITTWGPNLFEPATTAFWNAVREIRPDLFKGFNTWDRICDPNTVRALLDAGGVDRVEAVAEAGAHPIPTPEAWWSAVLGSGYRGTLEQLDASALERVRMSNLNFSRQLGIRLVEANVVYAVATKA